MGASHSSRRALGGLAAAFLAGLTAACGDSQAPEPGSSADAGTSSVSSSVPLSQLQIGHLEGGGGPAPGYIAGVHYTSAAASGYTDSSGLFYYQDGSPVQFAVGNVALGTLPGAAQLNPFSFSGSCSMSQGLQLMLRFLYGLDIDGNPSTGLQIPTVAAAAAPQNIATLSADELDAEVKIIAGADRGLAEQSSTVNSFITLVDNESWDQTFITDLGASGQLADQGVTTDGSSWIFSFTDGFMRQSDDYVILQLNPYAIPLNLAATQGSNHIGDIDYYNGKIYAPIEDGSAYLNPYVVIYDATTFLYTGTSYLMPQPLLTEGIPWNAVDGPRGYLYNAEWNYTLRINVFDLNTMALVGFIPLSQVLDRIQGAKVYEGNMYAMSDNFTDKAVYKINLETGTVMKMFSQLPDPNGQYSEFEGIVMRDMPDGTSMHTLDKYPNENGAYFRHFTRTVPPLRKTFCPS